MTKLNPIDLQKALKGVDYPANKQAILDAAKQNGASDDIGKALDRIPEKTYDRPTDVTEQVDFGGGSS